MLFKPQSFAEDTGHFFWCSVNICLNLLSVSPLHDGHQSCHVPTSVFCYTSTRLCTTNLRNVLPFRLKMHVLRASNITNTVLLTNHQKSSRWHMKHKNRNDMMSCTFSNTANLPHPSEAYASAHRTSVRGNKICRCISNRNSMYRSLLKSMTQYKSKHFFFSNCMEHYICETDLVHPEMRIVLLTCPTVTFYHVYCWTVCILVHPKAFTNAWQLYALLLPGAAIP